MGESIVLTGMILTAGPIGEYDKRITLLTKERGKISAFAKGARRQGSRLLAAASPFAFGEFEVYCGRNSYTVGKAVIKNYFRDLSKDTESLYYGYYFLEIANYYTKENADELHMLTLLYRSLRALQVQTIERRLIKCIFELKTLVLEGEYPNVFSCGVCGKKEDIRYFSTEKSGGVCSSCMRNLHQLLPLSPSVLYTMQFIITADIEKLYTFCVSDEVLLQLEEILKAYTKKLWHYEFKSLKILEEL
ncbi:hypothetical protein FACS1894111_07410 [Clostridia bacterium]|nr:hypothetical protein FACS1894111_07410 [Clostridia bacterium]